MADTWVKHNIAHSASIAANMVNELVEHPLVSDNLHWLTLAQNAHHAVAQLHKKVMAEAVAEHHLIQIIRQKSFRKGEFVLSSRLTSNYFFDLKPTMLDPVGISMIADMIMDRLPDEVDALAGIEIGGIPLAIAGSARSYQLMSTPLNALIVRKESKDHGTQHRIEGEIEPDMRVLLLDDVATTGGSLVGAVGTLERAGCHVVGALVVVDRMEGATEALHEIGVELSSLFRRSDFEYG